MTIDFWDYYTPDTAHKSSVFTEEEETGQYETEGKDLEYVFSVFKQTPKRVWTMQDDEDGNIVIRNGFHYVNRIAFIVTVEDGNGECFLI